MCIGGAERERGAEVLLHQGRWIAGQIGAVGLAAAMSLCHAVHLVRQGKHIHGQLSHPEEIHVAAIGTWRVGARSKSKSSSIATILLPSDLHGPPRGRRTKHSARVVAFSRPPAINRVDFGQPATRATMQSTAH
jgi:hypothetical protein